MENNNSLNHVVKIVERKNIIISGIKKIVSFDDKQFLLESNMGNIFIKGCEMMRPAPKIRGTSSSPSATAGRIRSTSLPRSRNAV